jgi:hypothetical protein
MGTGKAVVVTKSLSDCVSGECRTGRSGRSVRLIETTELGR